MSQADAADEADTLVAVDLALEAGLECGSHPSTGASFQRIGIESGGVSRNCEQISLCSRHSASCWGDRVTLSNE